MPGPPPAKASFNEGSRPRGLVLRDLMKLGYPAVYEKCPQLARCCAHETMTETVAHLELGLRYSRFARSDKQPGLARVAGISWTLGMEALWLNRCRRRTKTPRTWTFPLRTRSQKANDLRGNRQVSDGEWPKFSLVGVSGKCFQVHGGPNHTSAKRIPFAMSPAIAAMGTWSRSG